MHLAVNRISLPDPSRVTLSDPSIGKQDVKIRLVVNRIMPDPSSVNRTSDPSRVNRTSDPFRVNRTSDPSRVNRISLPEPSSLSTTSSAAVEN